METFYTFSHSICQQPCKIMSSIIIHIIQLKKLLENVGDLPTVLHNKLLVLSSSHPAAEAAVLTSVLHTASNTVSKHLLNKAVMSSTETSTGPVKDEVSTIKILYFKTPKLNYPGMAHRTREPQHINNPNS